MRNTALEYAVAMFRYREEAIKRPLPHDPDWEKVIRDGVRPAMNGEKGSTDQQQCAYQAIRLEAWESGRVMAPWGKAFLPSAVILQVAWYRRWWVIVVNWYQSFLKRFNGFV